MNKKHIFVIVMIGIMICAVLSGVGVVSAGKYKVDSGSVKYDKGHSMMKWVTYLDTKTNSRTVEVKLYSKYKKNKKYYSMELYQETLKKVSKTKLKITEFQPKSEETWVSYKKTRLTTKAYYWNVYRPKLIKFYKKQ